MSEDRGGEKQEAAGAGCRCLNLLAEENGRMLAEELRAQGAEGRVILLTPHVGKCQDC